MLLLKSLPRKSLPKPQPRTGTTSDTPYTKAGGVTLGNLMIAGFPNTLYRRPGRDEEIDKIRQSIQAAGQVGVPVVEYNFYAHRAMEGYYGETGRGGAG